MNTTTTPALRCSSCGAFIDATTRFCYGCGASTGADRNASAGAPSGAGQPAPETGQAAPPVWLTVLGTLFSPGSVVQRAAKSYGWPVSLGVSGVAFALFFLQTGLDVGRAGGGGALAVAAMAATGAVYGTAGVTVLALLAWVLTKPMGNTQTVGWAIKAVALAYSPALVSAALGLGLNLGLGWNTAVAFGVTGVLWALGPLTAVLKEMAGGRLAPAVTLTAVCGGLMLYGWSLLGAGG